MKLKLTLEYDGSAYYGFQLQANLPTIQGELERALHRVTGESIRVTAAGRTDTGVHAAGQVVSFRSQTSLPPGTLMRALNFYLPADIAVQAAQAVVDDFDARRSARSRHYRYLILNQPARSPLRRQYNYLVPHVLQVGAMAEACLHLIGEHDFAAFAAAMEPTRSTVRRVYRAEVRQEGRLAVFDIEANAFLPHQVRNTVGTLLEVGKGKLDVGGFRRILDARDRRAAGPAAPPHALYLMQVRYAEMMDRED